jgi:hypothetical protein
MNKKYYLIEAGRQRLEMDISLGDIAKRNFKHKNPVDSSILKECTLEIWLESITTAPREEHLFSNGVRHLHRVLSYKKSRGL